MIFYIRAFGVLIVKLVKIIHDGDSGGILSQQAVNQMRADEARAARNQKAFLTHSDGLITHLA